MFAIELLKYLAMLLLLSQIILLTGLPIFIMKKPHKSILILRMK